MSKLWEIFTKQAKEIAKLNSDRISQGLEPIPVIKVPKPKSEKDCQ